MQRSHQDCKLTTIDDLQSYFCLHMQVAEELVEWDYDMLLTEIASELNAEKLELQRHTIGNTA